MKTLRGSKSDKILGLYEGGMAPSDIAGIVGCTRSNVHKSIQRHCGGAKSPRYGLTRVSLLPPDDLEWLHAEAHRLGAPIGDIARALLIDAIEEARHGD